VAANPFPPFEAAMRSHLRKIAVLLALAAPFATAEAQTPDPAEFAVAGPLGEMALGDPEAPVTMVEYASLTCSHCGNFHNTTFAALKEKYIDTGKVYFILREFPLDPLALAAAMAARCGPEDDYFAIIDAMFTEQDKWAYVEEPAPALLAILAPYGFTDDSFATCLQDKSIVEGIVDVARRGQAFGVAGTPAFFFNGEKQSGAMTIERIDTIVEQLAGE
jgi:protein-disulfide isomerase